MSEKPNKCLHCAVADAVEAWFKVYHPEMPGPEVTRVIDALADNLGDLLSGPAARDHMAELYVRTTERMTRRWIRNLMQDDAASTDQFPMRYGFEAGTKH